MVPTPQQAAVQYANQSIGLSGTSLFPVAAVERRAYKLDVDLSPLKVYLDQAIFSPAAVAFFFGSMSMLEGKGVGEASNRISHVRLPFAFYN